MTDPSTFGRQRVQMPECRRGHPGKGSPFNVRVGGECDFAGTSCNPLSIPGGYLQVIIDRFPDRVNRERQKCVHASSGLNGGPA